MAALDAVTTPKEERRQRWESFWSEELHHTFPLAGRQRATTLLLLGAQLASAPQYAGESDALLAMWRECVMPLAMDAPWGAWWEP